MLPNVDSRLFSMFTSRLSFDLISNYYHLKFKSLIAFISMYMLMLNHLHVFSFGFSFCFFFFTTFVNISIYYIYISSYVPVVYYPLMISRSFNFLKER